MPHSVLGKSHIIFQKCLVHGYCRGLSGCTAAHGGDFQMAEVAADSKSSSDSSPDALNCDTKHLLSSSELRWVRSYHEYRRRRYVWQVQVQFQVQVNNA